MPRRVRSKNNSNRKTAQAKKAKKSRSKAQLRAFAKACQELGLNKTSDE